MTFTPVIELHTSIYTTIWINSFQSTTYLVAYRQIKIDTVVLRFKRKKEKKKNRFDILDKILSSNKKMREREKEAREKKKKKLQTITYVHTYAVRTYEI